VVRDIVLERVEGSALSGAPNAADNLPFRRTAIMLAAWQRNVDTSVDWADPSWTAALLRLDAAQLACVRHALREASEAARTACSRALVQAAGAAAPGFDQLAQPALARGAGVATSDAVLLDTLPAARGMQVLRMRALLFRRAEARRLIDKRTRQQLSEWVGVSVDRLTQDAHAAEPPDTARLIARAGMPPLAALDAARLAIEGCALLLRDLARGDIAQAAQAPPRLQAAQRMPFALLRLALPRVLPPVPWLANIPDELDASGSARLFARLADLLPEFAWLSG
jgi:type III secretion system HrpB4-like protein